MKVCLQHTSEDILMPRDILITILPHLHIDHNENAIVYTIENISLENPLKKDVNIVGLDETYLLLLNENNNHNNNVFIMSNILLDIINENLVAENNGNTWILHDSFLKITRTNGGLNQMWRDHDIVQNDEETRIPFISQINNSNNAGASIKLGFEKPKLALPLSASTEFKILPKETTRYTGDEDSTETITIDSTVLEVKVQNKHILKIIPSTITLDEYNNYTSFICIETNDDVSWFIDNIDERITVDKTDSTGRACVIVKKSDTFNLNENFTSIPLIVKSSVEDVTIEDFASIHLEKYTPVRNAIIPKMESNNCEDTTIEYVANFPNVSETLINSVYKSFNHSFSSSGIGGSLVNLNSLVENTFSLNENSAIEIAFNQPHRIRSWSLQSLGQNVYGLDIDRFAFTLVMQGQKLDGTWKMLDICKMPSNFYSADTKQRVDKILDHKEIVNKIRIFTALSNSGQNELIGLPQIQVFAGEPVLPKMIANIHNQGEITIRSSASTGYRTFDKEVGGNDLASIGTRNWYMNNNRNILEDVAEGGFIREVYQGNFESKSWLSLKIPRTQLLGFLYSIDNLTDRNDVHTNASYAASLYFEGRSEYDENATTLSSQAGNWNKIGGGLMSLDNCIGRNNFEVSTEVLINEKNQTRLNDYAYTLGLPIVHNTYFTNSWDWHIIRYNDTTETWYDDGFRLAPFSAVDCHSRTTFELLNEYNHSTLKTIAKSRISYLDTTDIPDKATMVNQVDQKRVMYDALTQAWAEVDNNDAIYRIQNQTYYKNLLDMLGDITTIEQLRFTVQSIMNTERISVDGSPVVMPEMQLIWIAG